MGNASTKERAAPPAPPNGESSTNSHGSSRTDSSSRRGRHGLESSLFGISVSSRETRERDREAERHAREIRRREREKERLKERERSLKEESVDGGYLVTMGVYTGTEDFKDKIVRHFMIERRLAPFFRGLRDHQDSWTDAQLVAAAQGLPIPGPEAEAPVERKIVSAGASADNLTVPIASRSRSQSYTSEGSTSGGRSGSSTPSFGFNTSRSRAKTLSISSPKNPVLPNNVGPAEINNSSRFVDGRPLEAVLYENAIECPICFLYYPPYLNKTRCCDQEICSECFVQIKRADPHIPDTHDEDHPPDTENPDQLVTEPATCPFCKQTDFGVTYTPPPFRRGLSFAPSSSSAVPSYFRTDSGATNDSSTSSISPPTSPVGRRRTMLPFNSPEVITTDMIRPDWSHKLASARSHAARRAAAATALHTAAFLLGSPNPPRRRRETPSPAPDPSPPVEDRLASLGFIPPRDAQQTRRNRMVDLEEMMLMEAIRLSLAEEENRKQEEAKGKGKEVEEAAEGERADAERANGERAEGRSEPMLNFESLTERIERDEGKGSNGDHVEHAEGDEVAGKGKGKVQG